MEPKPSISGVDTVDSAEFAFTEVAAGGPSKRGRVVKNEEVESQGADHFTSLYGHCKDFVDYVNDPSTGKGKGSCRGYKGAVKPGFVPFDIDREEMDDALRDARDLVRRLREDYGVPQDVPRIYFSGSKGFHVELPGECFGGLEASVNAPQKVKDLALRILDGMETDTAIYDRTRLWRSPNTINSKGNLYKVPLAHDELMNLPLARIKELARRPRTVSYATPEPVPALVDLKDATRVILRDDPPNIAHEQTANVVAVIQEFMPPVGERHLFARALAGYLLPRLKKPRTLLAMLEAWDGSGEDALRDVEQHVEDTAEKWMNDEPFEGGPKLDERAPGIVSALESALAANSANGANGYSHGRVEIPRFPVEAMPTKTRDFIRETAASIDCSVDLVGVPVLGAISAAIGQSREAVRSADHTQSAALYLACIDEPGSGKSPAMSAATRPIKERQQELKALYEERKQRYEDDLRQYEVDKKKAAKEGKAAPRPPKRPAFPRTWIDDTTIEALASRLEDNPRGLYLMQDELTGWIKGFDQYKSGGKGNTRQKYLQIWSNETISVDRVGRDEPTIVERPFVTLYGGIQPKLLKEIADGREDGFIDRFLLAYPEPHVSYENDNEVSVAARKVYHELIRRLYEGGDNPLPVEFTSEAKEVYKNHSHRISDEQKYGGMPSGLKNAWSKMRAYLIRLSLIMAVCRVAGSAESEVEEITVADVENAATLVEYFKGMARKAYGQINSFDTSSKVAYELISLLREKDGEIKVTADELREMLPSAPDTAEATSKLVERISKEHNILEFGRGWRHDGRVITLRLTEKTVGTVGTVGDPSDSSDILERKSEFASRLAAHTCTVSGEECPNPETCMHSCTEVCAVPIAYRLSEPDEAYCENCAEHTEQDITARPLRFTPEDRIWFASEVCRACGHEHPGLYDDGYVLYPEGTWGWYAIALEPTPTS